MNLPSASKTGMETFQETEDKNMKVDNPEPVVCEETPSIQNTPPHTSIKVQSPPQILFPNNHLSRIIEYVYNEIQ